MTQHRTAFIFAAVLCALVAGLILADGGRPVAAEGAITPTLIVTARNYLPAVRGLQLGPTVTATTPPPTMTASPTLSATPTPTDTPAPGRLAAPTLYDIINPGGHDSFIVGWSSAPEAEFYRLQQQRDGDAWQQIYEGPEQERVRSGLAAGSYCYRVKALNAVTDSEWSAVKCTAVLPPTSTPTITNTPEPPGLTAPLISPIANEDGDGDYTVAWTAVDRAEEHILREGGETIEDSEIIYRGPATSQERSGQPPGRYCYWVRGIIDGGEWGPWSERQCVEVNPPPSSTPTATPTPSPSSTPTPSPSSTPTATHTPSPPDLSAT